MTLMAPATFLWRGATRDPAVALLHPEEALHCFSRNQLSWGYVVWYPPDSNARALQPCSPFASLQSPVQITTTTKPW